MTQIRKKTEILERVSLVDQKVPHAIYLSMLKISRVSDTSDDD